MKYILAIICIISSRLCYSQTDTAAAPVKIFFSGSLSIVGGWEPSEGRFYSLDWYGDAPPKKHSSGTGFGLTTGIKLLKRTYLLTGIDFFNATFDKFRLSPAPDPRYHPVIRDTIYGSYSRKVFSIPIGIQLPLLYNRTTIDAHIGAAGEFTYSESYQRFNSDTSNGYPYKMSQTFGSDVTRFTGTRIETGVDVEFRNVIGSVFCYLGINYTSPPIGNQQLEKYFLSYNSTISFRLGIGYYFGEKKKERVEYSLL